MKIKAIKDHIICTEGQFGDFVSESGIVVKSTAGQSQGISARWFRVHAVGPDIDFLEPGQWVYVEHGRWTDMLEIGEEKTEMWRVDPNGCLAVSDEEPDHSLYYNKDVIPTEKRTR